MRGYYGELYSINGIKIAKLKDGPDGTMGEVKSYEKIDKPIYLENEQIVSSSDNDVSGLSSTRKRKLIEL